MYFLLTVESGKISKVELLQDSTNVRKDSNQYLWETDSDSEANALLNNYDKVSVTIGTSSVVLGFDGVPESVHGRRIPYGSWIKKVRPALMRSSTTTHLFNA